MHHSRSQCCYLLARLLAASLGSSKDTYRCYTCDVCSRWICVFLVVALCSCCLCRGKGYLVWYQCICEKETEANVKKCLSLHAMQKITQKHLVVCVFSPAIAFRLFVWFAEVTFRRWFMWKVCLVEFKKLNMYTCIFISVIADVMTNRLAWLKAKVKQKNVEI